MDIARSSGLRIQIPHPSPKFVKKEASSPHEHPAAKFLSVRSIFVLVSVATVFSVAAGLITISYNGQLTIVNDLIDNINEQITKMIVGEMHNLFSWADQQLYLSTFYFSNFTVPPRDVNVLQEWRTCLEPLWAIARGLTTGVTVEFDLEDNRFFGLDNFNEAVIFYYGDFQNSSDPDSLLVGDFWAANASLPISTVNLSPSNVIYSFETSQYYSNKSLLTCNTPHYWRDVFYFATETSSFITITETGTVCNKFGEMLGLMDMSIGISSIASVLAKITEQYKGKIFVMDQKSQLIASSTFTPIFGPVQVDGATTWAPRETAKNTSETWIRDVFDKLHSYEDQSHLVKINGTKYLLSVTNWNEFANVNFVIVKLLEYNQFVGSTYTVINNSIYATVGIAIGAVVIVLLLSYSVTQPLILLAHNMQKMSKLDLNFSNLNENPPLFEMRKLHHSFVGMNVAMKSFKKFVPVQIISRIIQSKKEVVAELQFCNVTVMFQDIAGFTSLSELLPPAQLAKLTSEYMEVMTTIICKHGGTIDKYVGDCIMSLFNAPEEIQNHQEAATAAAAECLMALVEKNKEWKAKYGVEMAFRTGINSGEVLVGNMGSDNRMNYTAFGDNVNIAARLEGVNKLFGTHIIISKSVHNMLPKGKYITRKLGKVRVSGKETPTTVYEVRGETNQRLKDVFNLYEDSRKAFRNQEFAKADVLIDHAINFMPTDKPSLHLKSRIAEALSQPLLESWSYVEDLVKF